MREETALELAVGLLQLPSRARALRDAPLPRDVDALLDIVADERHARADAARVTGLSEHTVSEAASFYIEQILLHPDADCYRALGASSDASFEQLRRNMALLLRWLHPDLESNSARTIYVGRVTDAWNNIKTAERRLAYDRALKTAAASKSAHRASVGGSSREGDKRKAHVPSGALRPLGRRPADTWSGRSSARRRGRWWRILARLLGQRRH